METPKQKALILVEKFYQNAPEVFGTGRAQIYAVECAKITVDEILKSVAPIDWGKNEDDIDFSNYFKYWKEVLTELNKL